MRLYYTLRKISRVFVQESLWASVLGVLCGCVGGDENDGCSPLLIGGGMLNSRELYYKWQNTKGPKWWVLEYSSDWAICREF